MPRLQPKSINVKPDSLGKVEQPIEQMPSRLRPLGCNRSQVCSAGVHHKSVCCVTHQNSTGASSSARELNEAEP